jgi:hypothetical protein
VSFFSRLTKAIVPALATISTVGIFNTGPKKFTKGESPAQGALDSVLGQYDLIKGAIGGGSSSPGIPASQSGPIQQAAAAVTGAAQVFFPGFGGGSLDSTPGSRRIRSQLGLGGIARYAAPGLIGGAAAWYRDRLKQQEKEKRQREAEARRQAAAAARQRDAAKKAAISQRRFDSTLAQRIALTAERNKLAITRALGTQAHVAAADRRAADAAAERKREYDLGRGDRLAREAMARADASAALARKSAAELEAVRADLHKQAAEAARVAAAQKLAEEKARRELWGKVAGNLFRDLILPRLQRTRSASSAGTFTAQGGTVGVRAIPLYATRPRKKRRKKKSRLTRIKRRRVA